MLYFVFVAFTHWSLHMPNKNNLKVINGLQYNYQAALIMAPGKTQDAYINLHWTYQFGCPDIKFTWNL